jgi:N-acetylmuramoyl-L-alanine amidase
MSNKKRTVFLSSGHSNKKGLDNGAVGNGYIEGVLTVNYVTKLAAKLRKLGVTVVLDDPSNAFAHTIAYFRNKTTSDAIVADFHWNASANPASTGVETLIPANPTAFEIMLAKDMSDDVSESTGIPLRGNYKGNKGVKTELESHHGRLGWMTLKGENILVEMGFISNPNDMSSFFENEEKLLEAHTQTLFKYSLR